MAGLCTSRSTRPVTLPLVTIMRRDRSPRVMPSGARSSCASKIEARQRGVEILAQALADGGFDQIGAGEKTQPQAQFVFMILRRFQNFGLGVEMGRCSCFSARHRDGSAGHAARFAAGQKAYRIGHFGRSDQAAPSDWFW